MIVDILLATYNGEKYLREQLDSILRQTNTDWRLVVRDDGSSDQTPAIIQEYAEKIKEKFGEGKCVILPPAARDPKASILPYKRISQNFSALIEWSKKDGGAHYVMFCDQDDVWYHDKINKSVLAMKELEKLHGKNMPLLVDTDVARIYEEKPSRNQSVEKAKHPNTGQHTFRNDLVSCYYQGCTFTLNRSLADIVSPVPDAAYGYDWWVGLVADSVGHKGQVPDKTMDYRVHKNNASIGIHTTVRNRAKRAFTIIDDCFAQAQILYSLFADRMHPDKREDTEQFLHIATEPRPKRVAHLIGEGFLRTTWVHNVALLGGHRVRE